MTVGKQYTINMASSYTSSLSASFLYKRTEHVHVQFTKSQTAILLGWRLCYNGRGENSRVVFTVIDHITQTLHYSNARPRFQPYWASSGASGVQNAYMQGHIYTGTTWRVTSSVPTQYRCYMYSSVADLMAAGSWQLTPVSQSPTCPFRAMRLCWPLLCVTSIVSIDLPG